MLVPSRQFFHEEMLMSNLSDYHIYNIRLEGRLQGSCIFVEFEKLMNKIVFISPRTLI